MAKEPPPKVIFFSNNVNVATLRDLVELPKSACDALGPAEEDVLALPPLHSHKPVWTNRRLEVTPQNVFLAIYFPTFSVAFPLGPAKTPAPILMDSLSLSLSFCVTCEVVPVPFTCVSSLEAHSA